MADGKKKGMDGLLKTILIFVIIIVMVAGMLLTLFLGIINIFKDTVKDSISALGDSASKGMKWLGLAKVEAEMQTFIVNQ